MRTPMLYNSISGNFLQDFNGSRDIPDLVFCSFSNLVFEFVRKPYISSFYWNY